MIETGIVSKVENDKAWVVVVKGEHCKNCNACSAFGDGSAEIEVINQKAAKPGDKVDIEIDPKQVIRHSAIVFLLPVLGLVVGYFVGVSLLSHWGINGETAGIIGSIGLLAISYIGIIAYDRFLGKSREVNSAQIIKIYKKGFIAG